MTIKVALLDESGVYLRMDELADESQLTDRHVPRITACDLPAGEYRWVPDERKNAAGEMLNPYGGAFWQVSWLQLVELADAPTEGLALRIEKNKRGVV